MPRNGAKKKMKELGVTATSGGRATPGFAIAPLLRNGYAALRSHNAEMRKKLKNPLSEQALQSKGICFMFRLASVATKISSRQVFFAKILGNLSKNYQLEFFVFFLEEFL